MSHTLLVCFFLPVAIHSAAVVEQGPIKYTPRNISDTHTMVYIQCHALFHNQIHITQDILLYIIKSILSPTTRPITNIAGF